MNPRPVQFEGVERPATEAPTREDWMREHSAVRASVRDSNQRFVPRRRPVTMTRSGLSAESWDLVVAIAGGTIYLPRLTQSDAGDEVTICVASGAATVRADGMTVVGSTTVTGPLRVVFEWDGIQWWRG